MAKTLKTWKQLDSARSELFLQQAFVIAIYNDFVRKKKREEKEKLT